MTVVYRAAQTCTTEHAWPERERKVVLESWDGVTD